MPEQPPSATAQVTALVESHVREIVEAAERAARDLADEVEAASVLRATEVRRAAEQDAARIRAAAEVAAQAHVDEARRTSTTWAAERVAHMEELSAALVAGGDSLRRRLPEAEELHQSLQHLVSALAVAARAIVAEATRPPRTQP